eukprot:4670916-Amphidinium_carterae.1
MQSRGTVFKSTSDCFRDDKLSKQRLTHTHTHTLRPTVKVEGIREVLRTLNPQHRQPEHQPDRQLDTLVIGTKCLTVQLGL